MPRSMLTHSLTLTHSHSLTHTHSLTHSRFWAVVTLLAQSPTKDDNSPGDLSSPQRGVGPDGLKVRGVGTQFFGFTNSGRWVGTGWLAEMSEFDQGSGKLAEFSPQLSFRRRAVQSCVLLEDPTPSAVACLNAASLEPPHLRHLRAGKVDVDQLCTRPSNVVFRVASCQKRRNTKHLHFDSPTRWRMNGLQA